MRPFIILLIPIVIAIAVFFPRRISLDWMETALEAIEYRDAGRLELMLDNPELGPEDFEQFLATLEEEFWPLQRFTPFRAISKDVEVIAQIPELKEGLETTKIWVAVVDGYGRKGIFTLYVTPDQDQILAMELIAEPK